MCAVSDDDACKAEVEGCGEESRADGEADEVAFGCKRRFMYT